MQSNLRRVGRTVRCARFGSAEIALARTLTAAGQFHLPTNCIGPAKNRFIYYGIRILVATVSLWLGAELTKRVEWVLPYTAGLSIALIVGGFIYEWWRTRGAQR
jgi:hypothetical protein